MMPGKLMGFMGLVPDAVVVGMHCTNAVDTPRGCSCLM